MKKRILTLGIVLALVMALVIPATVAMAAEGSDDVTLEGTMLETATIDVVAPIFPGFGDFTVGVNGPVVATAGSVTVDPGNTEATSYIVTAKDKNQGTGSGFMLQSDKTALGDELTIYGGDGPGYQPASTGDTYTGSALSGSLPFQARQEIVGTDAAGVYTIIIEFAGTITF